jgi:hypothetical protein
MPFKDEETKTQRGWFLTIGDNTASAAELDFVSSPKSKFRISNGHKDGEK